MSAWVSLQRPHPTHLYLPCMRSPATPSSVAASGNTCCFWVWENMGPPHLWHCSGLAVNRLAQAMSQDLRGIQMTPNPGCRCPYFFTASFDRWNVYEALERWNYGTKGADAVCIGNMWLAPPFLLVPFWSYLREKFRFIHRVPEVLQTRMLK